MRSQQAAVRAAVEAAERISVLLAGYETEQAAELMAGGGGEYLPPRLLDALRQLVANLEQY
eukprot:gene29355-11067_t